MSQRINARLSQPSAEFVDRMVSEAGLYETPSEYVCDLIRRDMERREGQSVQDAIYDLVLHGIAVLSVQHQVRDIESLIADLTPALPAEVERLKRKA